MRFLLARSLFSGVCVAQALDKKVKRIIGLVDNGQVHDDLVNVLLQRHLPVCSQVPAFSAPPVKMASANHMASPSNSLSSRSYA